MERGSEVRGAGTESFIYCFYLYEMYENLNACTLLFHVFSYFLQFSRNRLGGDESPPGDSSYFWVIGGSGDGTAWRHGLNRQAVHVRVPSFLGFMKGLAVTNTR